MNATICTINDNNVRKSTYKGKNLESNRKTLLNIFTKNIWKTSTPMKPKFANNSSYMLVVIPQPLFSIGA